MDMQSGIDILDINRIEKILKEKKRKALFIKKVFTQQEIKTFPKNKDIYYALNFSFKESIWKAIPENIQKKTYIKNIEILWYNNNPELFLFNKKIKNIHLKFIKTNKHIVTTAIL